MILVWLGSMKCIITLGGTALAGGGSERNDTAGGGEFGVVVGGITKAVRTVFFGLGSHLRSVLHPTLVQ